LADQRSHPLVENRGFKSLESYVLHLMHQRAYEEACKLVEKKRVLDWGCNDGYGLELMRSRAKEIAGIDVAPRAVEAARKRLADARIELFDGKRSSFADGSFDVITSFQLIEHISDHPSFFSELVRVLAPDGIAVFTTPNGKVRLNEGMRPWNEYHVREFTPDELRRLLDPWFEQIEILGMTGAEETIAVERGRIESAKARQRSRIPIVRGALRRVRALLAGNGGDELSQEELDRFSTADLVYSPNADDVALDLMAICRRPRPRTAS
jgi:2-polyprenyl-3-methyl-5-hydroxy-6-metoxy-1,4-benzoquinol methylase